MNKYVLLSFLLIHCFVLKSQEKRHTCHQTHKPVHAKALTPEERGVLNDSNQRSDTFNILNYAIHIDITDYFGQYIDAYTIIDVSPKMDDVTVINLDLYELTVDSVYIGSTLAEYTYDGAILSVQTASPTVEGEEFQITVWYNGQPYQDPQWGGFYFENNYIYNLGIGLSTIPPNFGKVWYPCFDTFVERATYDFHILSDDGFTPRCQGMLMSEVELGGDSIESYYRLSIPIPTYLSAIAAADYTTIAYEHTGAFGSIPVELQAKTGQQDNMELRFTNLGSAIDAMEYWYGPYIWNKVGYVMTTVGAMEHATNIAYPQNMMSASTLANEQLFSHELGHLWFGDMVSPEIHNHMWLKEGHAEYSQHLMREWHSGHEAFIAEVKDNQLFVLESAHVDDEGFHPLSPIPDEVIYGRHTYYKGAAAVHTLRGYVGDSLFREGLQGVLDTFYLGHMNPEQYNSAFSNTTGYDITEFMNGHIYNTGFSTFVIDSSVVENVGGMWSTELYLQQKLRETSVFNDEVPLDISVVYADWSSETFQDVLSGEFDQVNIQTNEEPILYYLNRDYKINQARMDYEAVLFEETNTETLPWVDLKLKVLEIGDTALFRAEHHWVGPDDELMDDDVFDISNTHYWTIGGIWDEDLSMEARLTYRGYSEWNLDSDLVGDTEDNIGLVFRENGGDTWSIFPWYTLQAGSNNGSGTIKIDSLVAGEYAFANIETVVGLEEHEELSTFNLYPNPVVDRIFLNTESPGRYQFQIMDSQGKLILEKLKTLDRFDGEGVDVSSLASGKYEVILQSLNGRYREALQFIKE